MKNTQKRLTLKSLEERLELLELENSLLRSKCDNLEQDLIQKSSKLEQDLKDANSLLGDLQYDLEEVKEVAHTACSLSEDVENQVNDFQSKIDQIAEDVSDVLILKS